METKEPIGELLVERKLITRDQLNQAIAEQNRTKEPLGSILLRFNFVESEAQLKAILSEQLKVPYLSDQELKPRKDQRLKELVPAEIARAHLILPLERSNRELKLAISRRPDLMLIDNLKKMTDCEVMLVLVNEEAIKKAIGSFYGSTELVEMVTSSEVSKASETYDDSPLVEQVDLEAAALGEGEAAPVVKLVDLLIKKALDDRASDIHIEPFQDTIMFRYRIDGALYELPPPPKQFHLAVVSRIKILAQMDIAEKRVPQDGSFSVNYQDRKVDVRVSTVPVIHGEKVVLRLLDKRTELLDLNTLGFEPHQLRLFEQMIRRPHGLIFITGPTGSGKSTTLYAAVNKRKSTAINIVTIEDPVEYQISGVNQVQVKPDIGLTFSNGLRAFLRQDPDIIFVGEVRDQETAEICIRAALTGRLVLSTLHTNDAASAVTRLVDIGIQPYLVAGSLILVGAQRLIRRLCKKCKEPFSVSEQIKKEFGFDVETIYAAKGCSECRNIGYWGRVAIYEFLPIDDHMRSAISRNASLDHLRQVQRDSGLETLRKSALKKVAQGLTTLDEALSITYE